jgi:hypothetical protein
MLERIDRLVQMPARQVQVDAGCLQVGMAEQYLDRGQIGCPEGSPDTDWFQAEQELTVSR